MRKNSIDRKRHLWKFLNSPLALLLLSSVIISGIGKIFTDYQHKIKDNIIRQNEIYKTATEFSYRVAKIKHHFKALNDKNLSKDDIIAHGVYIWRMIVGDQFYRPSLPEFNSFNMFGLINQLKIMGISENIVTVQDSLIDIEYAKDLNGFYDMVRLKKDIDILESFDSRLKQIIYAMFK